MELLVTKHEPTNHRLRQKLPRMPTEQGIQTRAIRTVLAIGASLRSVAINFYVLHYGTAALRELRPTLGNHRLIHQNGRLHSP